MTMEGVTQFLTQAGPGVATIAIVLYFLDKKDKQFTDTIKETSRTFALKIEELGKQITFLGDTNKEMKLTQERHIEENKELRRVLQGMYEHHAKKNQQL